MEPFSQTVVNIRDAPDVLRPSFFRTTEDFSLAVNRAISRISDPSPTLGITILLTVQDAVLEALALATTSGDIFILKCRGSSILGPHNDLPPDTDALVPLLRGQEANLVGFGMARIAMHVRYGLGIHVRGIDLADAAPRREKDLSPGAFVKNYVDPNSNTFAVDTLWDALPSYIGGGFSRLEHLALRAWLTVKVASELDTRHGLGQCLFADTTCLPSKHLTPIHQMLIEVEQMEASKPRVLENDFKGTFVDEKGNVVIENDRFNTRVRPSERREVWMIDDDDALHRGTARRANGKLTQVAPRSNLGRISLKAIFVVGKEESGHADRAREKFLLRLLQGEHDLHNPCYEMIRQLYFPDGNESPPLKVTGADKPDGLNQSQADVVEAMVSSEATFVIVHGPPGTGKTSTISAAVQSWVRDRDTVWVVAQSNVAVKNIAERLSKDEVSYRLLVSKEFYHEWHEHIYDDRVKDALIRTDELPARKYDISVLLHEIDVVLCTLSTLSNPSLEAKDVFAFVPVINLVVDEASQIGIFDYMHIFARFKGIRKACFFGDPKQLPPFGKEAAATLQSIFDVRHLKPQAYFLSTQYRIPVPVGQFISETMYNGKLQSQHSIAAYSCIAFIDVSLGGEEEIKKSYVNKREVQTVEHLVRHYYQRKNYCIVTPYDAQRTLLEKTLKASGLRSDNIYNVDSFQGNEADYILVSVVRSTSPGFLTSRNRVNVMLTRCKLGMVIVTSRAFMLQRTVKNTLLGEMCQYWEERYGRKNTWRDWKDVAEKGADLPGTGDRVHRSMARPDHEESFNFSRRTSVRAPSLPGSDIHRSGASLAPTSARLSTPSRSSGIVGDASLQRGSRIVPVSDKFAQMSLAPSSRNSASVMSQVQSYQPNERSARGGSAFPKDRVSEFPGLPSATRTIPAARVGGSWANGPPGSSRVQSPVVPMVTIPSRKLTSLKKISPSENVPPSQKKGKKWEWLPLF